MLDTPWTEQLKKDAYEIAFPGRWLAPNETIEVTVFNDVDRGYCNTCWEGGDGVSLTVSVIRDRWVEILRADPEWNVFKPAAERPGQAHFYDAKGVLGSYGRSRDKRIVHPRATVESKRYVEDELVVFFYELMRRGSL